MSTSTVSPVLVGRAGQLASLGDALAVARRGRPATVLIGGEAGVGKSRRRGEAAALAHRLRLVRRVPGGVAAGPGLTHGDISRGAVSSQ